MKKLALLVTALMLFSPAAHADEDFDIWLREFAQEAVDKGISVPTVEQALSGVRPIEQVLRLDRKQPKSTITFDQYRQNVVTPTRVKKGKELYNKNRALLDRISNKSGVPPQYIIALWASKPAMARIPGISTSSLHLPRWPMTDAAAVTSKANSSMRSRSRPGPYQSRPDERFMGGRDGSEPVYAV